MLLKRNRVIPLIYHYGLRTLEESFVPQNVSHYIILPKGTIVYNAKNTTDDKVEFKRTWYNSMIQLWKELTDEYDPDCCNAYCHGNNEYIVGGHVIREGESPVLRKGDEVLIVPLCKSCNHYKNDDPIAMVRDTKAVVLRWEE